MSLENASSAAIFSLSAVGSQGGLVHTIPEQQGNLHARGLLGIMGGSPRLLGERKLPDGVP